MQQATTQTYLAGWSSLLLRWVLLLYLQGVHPAKNKRQGQRSVSKPLGGSLAKQMGHDTVGSKDQF